MERPAQRYFCNKCGYVGNVDLHSGCGYLAYHLAPFEQNYIDQLERELALLKVSPASASEGWKHSCNALCLDGVELWIPQCPHCGKPAPTPPVSEDQKDAERLDYLQDHGATVSVVWLPIVRLLGFEVGGLRKTRKPSLRDAIDAAIQEDKS